MKGESHILFLFPSLYWNISRASCLWSCMFYFHNICLCLLLSVQSQKQRPILLASHSCWSFFMPNKLFPQYYLRHSLKVNAVEATSQSMSWQNTRKAFLSDLFCGQYCEQKSNQDIVFSCIQKVLCDGG